MTKPKQAAPSAILAIYSKWWMHFIAVTQFTDADVSIFQPKTTGKLMEIALKPIWLKSIGMRGESYEIFIQGKEVVDLSSSTIIKSNISVSYFEKKGKVMTSRQAVRYDFHPDTGGKGEPIFHAQVGSIKQEIVGIENTECFRGCTHVEALGKYIQSIRIPTPFLGFFGVMYGILADCQADKLRESVAKIGRPENLQVANISKTLQHDNHLAWYPI